MTLGKSLARGRATRQGTRLAMRDPHQDPSTSMLRIFPKSLLVNLGWTTIAYGIVQVLRLVNNVVLSRLLAPQLLGLMLIVNTIRIGIELLSDVGIVQNIVRNPRGDTPEFYDTAWVVTAVRGFILGALCFLLSDVAARFFENPQLAVILPVASLFFMLTGLDSTGRGLLFKRGQIERLSVIEVGMAAFSVVVHIVLALITPTIWALILGSLFVAAGMLCTSFLAVPGLRHRLRIDVSALREMFHFGRWIFVSSVVYFAAMNFDRIYLAKEVPLALLGVFGIARTLADTISAFVNRIGGTILFPLVATMTGSNAEIRGRLIRGRRIVLVAGAFGLALFTALSDGIVGLLYDDRYLQAGEILPILALGVWFRIIAGINDSILVGLGHPKLAAAGNAAKLLTYIVGVPLAIHHGGFDAAVLVLSLGELVRYLVLWLLGRREGIGFVRDDVAATLLFMAAVVGLRELLAAVGLTSGIEGLFPYLARLLT